MNKQRSTCLRISGAFLCVFAMMLCMFNCIILPVHAAQTDICIVGKIQDKGIGGVSWKLYAVGEKAADGKYVLTGDFSDYPVSLDKIDTASEAVNAAGTLAAYAEVDGIKPLSEAVSDEKGSAVLSGAGKFVYLITGSVVIDGDTKYIPSPMLGEFTDAQLGGDIININAKFSAEDIEDESSEYGVEKVWINADDRDIPESISVEIYKDNELEETAQLSAKNDWKYFWEGDSKAVWNVKEKNVPDDCTVVYKEAETVFRIENTYADDSTDESSESTSETSSKPSDESDDSGNESEDEKTPPDSSNNESGDTHDDSKEQVTSEGSSMTPDNDSSKPEQVTGEDSSSKSEKDDDKDSATADENSEKSDSKSADSKDSSSKSGTGTGTGNGGGTTNTTLPQTGSLWWPVPVMAGAGLLLMAAGVRVSRKKEN